MEYKEFKLKPGEAKSLSEIWNAGMNPSQNQKAKGKKPGTVKRSSGKKTTGKK